MGRGENRNEVILPCPNRSFRFVSAMIVRRDTLKVDAGLGGLKEGSSEEISLSIWMWVRGWDRDEKNLEAER